MGDRANTLALNDGPRVTEETSLCKNKSCRFVSVNSDTSSSARLIAELPFNPMTTDKTIVVVAHNNTEFATAAIKNDSENGDKTVDTHRYVGPEAPSRLEDDLL